LKRKKNLKILVGAGAAVLLILFFITVLTKFWVRKKVETALNENNSDYLVTVDNINTSLILSSIELEGLKINSKNDSSEVLDLKGEIGSIKFKGIKSGKAIFKKVVNIREVIISECNFTADFTSSGDTIIPILVPLDVRIGLIYFDKINLFVKNTANAQSYSVKEGVLRLSELNVEKHDTLSPDAVKQFDFNAKEIVWGSADSMSLYRNTGINYSAATNTLSIDSSSFHPNYTDYDFTSRYKFQKNRIEATLSKIFVHDFDIKEFTRSGSLRSSFVEVGNMNMKVFRDNRKEFNHTKKPEFQDIIYNYRSNIKIDSIALITGDVTYKEHSKDANEPGYLTFNDINARIYNITNDTIYKTDTAFLMLKTDAMFMDKSRINLFLNARLFDSKNTFSLRGTLAAIEAEELNPILENKAFIYVTSGKIQGMNFSFTADNTKSHGTMTMLYQGLDLAVKNKRTDDTTAIRERFISVLVNYKVINSNPSAGQDVRVGIISYERDPERFLIGYCARSLMSGIMSSLIK